MGLALNQSGLLFMPRRWQRAVVLRWLKRIHAWTGFWGALLFLMLGVSGVLLNHRNIWKIETGEPKQVSAINVGVTPGSIPTEKALGTWAKKTLDLPSEPRGVTKYEGKSRTFLGKVYAEVPKWSQQFSYPDGRIIVDYVPGANSVSVRQDATNALGLIKNLHKGTGVGLAWVLFMDSIAGALIAMSLTGFLLWTRLHGGRLLAGGILLGSVSAALLAITPYFMV